VKNGSNPADPYMKLVGYFNSLRELGGSRRIVEDEVYSRVRGYGSRLRVGEHTGLFADLEIQEAVELTSRVSTGLVSKAKERLAKDFTQKDDRWCGSPAWIRTTLLTGFEGTVVY
jgi:hypothetical protein